MKQYIGNIGKPDICPSCGTNSDNQTTCCMKVSVLKKDREALLEAAKEIVRCNITNNGEGRNECDYCGETLGTGKKNECPICALDRSIRQCEREQERT